ncbi:MAG TPA: ABC transporter ATP-binding protein, partial [Lachnospiraceae bacterium]|nr:ABC transporter ATP-binding protein [Lachnospiraceae bacterium]
KFADHIIGMKKGSVLFEGSPKDVITVENLRNLYEIEATLMMNKEKGYPICTDYSLLKKISS